MTTQQDCSIGIGREDAYGQPAVPSQWFEFTEEAFDAGVQTVQGAGLRVGSRVPRAARRIVSQVDPSGALTVEAPTKGLGALLAAVLGGMTNTPVPGQAGVWQQVHTPTTTDPLSSWTVQQGIPPVGGGPTLPTTFTGMVGSTMELSLSAGEYLTAAFELVGKDYDTATGYYPPSYPVLGSPFAFVHAALCLGGTVVPPTATELATGGDEVVNLTEWSLSWDNALDDGGFGLGGGGRRTRRPVTGVSELTGSMTVEVTDTKVRDAYYSQERLDLLVTFVHTETIGTDVHPTLQVWVPAVKLDGETPQANGGDVITISPSWVGLDPLGGVPPLTVVYRTTDQAPW